MNLVPFLLDYSIKVSHETYSFLNSDFIFIPYSKENFSFLAESNMIKKGSLIAKNNNHLYTSTISGKIVGTKKLKNQEFIAIANDFKEKRLDKIKDNRKSIKSREDLESLLKKFCVNFLIEPNKNLIVNLIENEPYILSDTRFFSDNIVDCLEVLDFIKVVYNYKNIVILIKNTETELLLKLNDIIGTYPDINIVTVPNLYLINKKENYKKYLNDDIANCYEINTDKLEILINIIKFNQLPCEKYITITGDALKNPMVVKVKKGALVKNVIKECFLFMPSDLNIVYYINSVLKPPVLDIDELIVDDDLKGIVVSYKRDKKSEDCIKCGLCNKYCPMNLDPIKYYRKNVTLKCLNCGICNYVCPSNIDFKKIIKEDNNE